jgi:hypothetical protein
MLAKASQLSMVQSWKTCMLKLLSALARAHVIAKQAVAAQAGV